MRDVPAPNGHVQLTAEIFSQVLQLLINDANDILHEENE